MEFLQIDPETVSVEDAQAALDDLRKQQIQDPDHPSLRKGYIGSQAKRQRYTEQTDALRKVISGQAQARAQEAPFIEQAERDAKRQDNYNIEAQNIVNELRQHGFTDTLPVGQNVTAELLHGLKAQLYLEKGNPHDLLKYLNKDMDLLKFPANDRMEIQSLLHDSANERGIYPDHVKTMVFDIIERAFEARKRKPGSFRMGFTAAEQFGAKTL